MRLIIFLLLSAVPLCAQERRVLKPAELDTMRVISSDGLGVYKFQFDGKVIGTLTFADSVRFSGNFSESARALYRAVFAEDRRALQAAALRIKQLETIMQLYGLKLP